MGVGRGRDLAGVALDGARARRTTKGRSATVVADEEKCLSGVVRIRTWLAHELSGYCSPAAGGRTLGKVRSDRLTESPIQIRERIVIGFCLLIATACGPRAHIPPRPLNLPGALAPTDSIAILARSLAPVLYQQRDETFPLSRAVAIVHPTRRVIAYHLLWRDDVHGAWVPFTVPTGAGIIWVGHDSTGAPTDIWTYWHGRVLHTDWRGKGTPAVDVQWGKHGSLPHGTALGDLPASGTLNLFYAFTILGAPDIWLSNTMRNGPW